MRKQLLGTVLAAALCVVGGSASAGQINIGGIDTNTQYTGFDTPGTTADGVLTFDDQFNGGNTPELGQVTTSDIGLLSGSGAKTNFEVILSALNQSGGAFNPATDNLKQARFLGANAGADFYILDPNDNSTVVLAFDINYIDITQASKSSVADPDGLILLGDPSLNSASSQLTLIGGSLNALAGGIGAQARLEVLFSTISPAILTKADFSGYLNSNFMSGVGAPPVATTTWNLRIFVPEPGSAMLVGFGLLTALAMVRRSSRR